MLKNILTGISVVLISTLGFTQPDSTSTLQGGGMDQNLMDSLGLVNPEIQKKYNLGVKALTSKDYMGAIQRFTEVILIYFFDCTFDQ